jgi:hypothetical protein
MRCEGDCAPSLARILFAHICLQQVLMHTDYYKGSQLIVVPHTVITYNVHSATEPSTLISPWIVMNRRIWFCNGGVTSRQRQSILLVHYQKSPHETDYFEMEQHVSPTPSIRTRKPIHF